MATRRCDKPEPKRTAILNAARCVFARNGFADTNVEDIAAEAKVAKGTIYLYFPSKQQIYMAALLEDARGLDLVSRQRIEAVPHWRDKVRAYMEVRLEYLVSHPEFLRIYLAEIRRMMLRGVPTYPEFVQLVHESEVHLAQIFAAASARGEIRDVDAELAALLVIDLTRGMMERRLLAVCRTREGDVEFALDLLSHSLERVPDDQKSRTRSTNKGRIP